MAVLLYSMSIFGIDLKLLTFISMFHKRLFKSLRVHSLVHAPEIDYCPSRLSMPKMTGMTQIGVQLIRIREKDKPS